ncbi:MAG: adenine deaminase C-terminal domain-containing protein [Halanaeroarchaeum sp.]
MTRVHDVQATTLGRAPADLVLTGGRVLSPARRALLDRDLVVVDGRIAGLSEDATAVVGEATTVVDVDGGVIAPGLVDPHTHLDLHQTIETSYHRVLAGGTTAIVSEVAAWGPSFGADAVETLLDATASLPVKVFPTVPPQPLFDMFEEPWATDADEDALRSLLDRDRVVGVGETAWIRIVGRDTPARGLYDAAHDREKVVTGHGAGCRGDRLQAFATTVDDDHEAIAGAGVLERVTSGIHAVGRYGTIRDDMAAVGDAYEDLDPAEMSLSTDGMWPRDLVEEGYMDAVLSRAVEAGVDPIDAVVMATLTPARHWDLDGLGTLRPGTPADLVVFADLDTFTVERTYVDGEAVYEGGEPQAPEAPTTTYPDSYTDLVDLDLAPGDLAVPAEAATDGEVLAIEYGGGLLTDATVVSPPESGGTLDAFPPDLLKVALFDRHPRRDGRGFVGFLSGFGLDRGALATTLTWETTGVLAVGTNDSDMHHAIATLEGLGGGWAVVADETVVATHATPIGATCSRRPVEETADRYDAVDRALGDLGTTADRPMLGLQTLSFVGVPSLKIGFDGYADIRAGEVVGLTPPS